MSLIKYEMRFKDKYIRYTTFEMNTIPQKKIV